MKNPYNCTIPGNLFVGYDRVRQTILKGFEDNKHYGIIGGKQCGKTSFLQQIRKDLLNTVFSGIHFIPCLFSTLEFNALTTANFFQKIYALATRGTTAPDWRTPENGFEYDGFLQQMYKARTLIEHTVGGNFIIVLLIDEMDAAIDDLKKNRLFKNLRHFLKDSEIRDNFILIASGAQSMIDLINDESSPFNVLYAEYLRILSVDEARQLIHVGLQRRLDAETENMIFDMTGRHPFLMQWFLELFFEKEHSGGVKPDWLDCSKKFLGQSAGKCFKNWANTFNETDHALYTVLLRSRECAMDICTMKERLNKPINHIEYSLRKLGYHGVVDDSDTVTKKISGTLFRDWYTEVYPQKKDTIERTDTVDTVSVPEQHGAAPCCFHDEENPVSPILSDAGNAVPNRPEAPMKQMKGRCIKIFTLGKLSIFIHDKAIDLTTIKEHLEMKVLKAILSFGGIDVPNADLEKIFWPGSIESAKSLNQAIHRLKEKLSNDFKCSSCSGFISRIAGKTSVNRDICFVDSIIFNDHVSSSGLHKAAIGTLEKTISSGRLAVDSDGFRDLVFDSLADVFIKHIEQGIGCYNGDFLPGENDIHIKNSKDRFKKTYIESVLVKSCYLAANKNYCDAKRCIETARLKDGSAIILDRLYHKLAVVKPK